MRVLLVTGAYPPVKCGVGDYTYHLAEALASLPDVEVGVLTGAGVGMHSGESNVEVIRVLPNWRMRSALYALRAIKKFKPDIVHIQYPTKNYDGRLPQVLPLIARLRGLSVVQTWHEHYVDCGMLGWLNLLACDALIYVRPDLPAKLPRGVAVWLAKSPKVYIPNASTIPIRSLSLEESRALKNELSGGKPIVAFFGFAHPNKGVESLFEIVDPEKYQLLLMCDLSANDPYQAHILSLASQENWVRSATVTGFLPSVRVGELLAVADAVVFPFPEGAGEWNTSLKAAESAGAFVIATTQNASLLGYHEENNIYYAGCGRVSDMRAALNQYIGRRSAAAEDMSWQEIAMTHEQIYQDVSDKA